MMRRISLGILLLSLSAGLWGKPNVSPGEISLKRGEDAFHRALENDLDRHYLAEAGIEYRKALELGAEGWEIHYNLGNIEYLMENLSYAQLEYSRARYISPGKRILNENIDIIKGSDKNKSPDWLQAILYGSIYILGYKNAYFWGFILYLTAWTLIISGKFLNKKFLKLIGIFLVILALWNTGLCISWNYLHSRSGIFLTESPSMYNGDSRAYSRVSSEFLKGGTAFKRLEERQEWSYVMLPDGTRGWVENSEFQMILLPEETLDLGKILE